MSVRAGTGCYDLIEYSRREICSSMCTRFSQSTLELGRHQDKRPPSTWHVRRFCNSRLGWCSPRVAPLSILYISAFKDGGKGRPRYTCPKLLEWNRCDRGGSTLEVHLLTFPVAFDAEPFQRPQNPLQFRSIPDSLAQYHVEASECCTIHYDNPLSQHLGVWMNPSVRVGYSPAAYRAVSDTYRDGKKVEWPTDSELRWGYWRLKWLWWMRDPGSPLKTWYRIRQWRRRFPNVSEPGLACASDLAMVLTSNGWAMRGARFE